MDKTRKKWCLICLKREEETSVSESLPFTYFFIQVIGVKEQCIKDNLRLCVWCKAALNRALKLIKIAQESQKVLATHNEANYPNTKILKKELYNLSYHNNDNINIRPEFEESNESTRNNEEAEEYIDIEETCTNTELNRNEIEGNTIEETILNEYSNENISNVNGETVKRHKKDIHLEEMMFEVKFLDTEEQMKEIELKKNSEKYKSMNYHCEDCGLGFLTDDVFAEHNSRHKKDAGPHKCDICHLRFKSKLVISQHILAHRRRFICGICQAVFKRWGHCIGHRYKCGTIQSLVACEECKKIFSDPHSLDVHVKGVHKKEKTHICDKCDKRFASKQRLRVHLRTHTAHKQFACVSCARAFATRSNLRAHASLHAPSGLHYCVECNTHYKSDKGLRRHLAEAARHLVGETLIHKCIECSKGFATEKALNTHTNVRHLTSYRCSLCNKTFSNNANLRKHIRCIHSAKTEAELIENSTMSS